MYSVVCIFVWGHMPKMQNVFIPEFLFPLLIVIGAYSIYIDIEVLYVDMS